MFAICYRISRDEGESNSFIASFGLLGDDVQGLIERLDGLVVSIFV